MLARTLFPALIALSVASTGCLEDKQRGGDAGPGADAGDGDGDGDGDIVGDDGDGDGGVDLPEDGGQDGAGDDAGGGGAEDGGGDDGDEEEPPRREACDDDDGCTDERICENGFCSEPICEADGDCGSMLQACRDGRCRDRCLGPGTCIRGGICVDGACMPPECNVKEDCGDPLKTCEGGACIDVDPCQGDEDCDDVSRCIDQVCEPLPVCGGDRNCDDNEICQDGRCREQGVCDNEEQCGDAEDCIGGRCVPFVCRGHADCDEGTECRGGECLPPLDVPISEIIILSRARTLFPDQEVQLRAIAVDAAGDIVATNGFVWESSEAGVVGVDEATGLATAGDQAGASEIRAGMADAAGEVLRSEPLTLTVAVIEDVEGVRVRVTDSLTGTPIPGASVVSGALSGATDDRGIAVLAEVGAAVTVFAAGHDTVTIVGTELDAIHVPLRPRQDARSQAGFTGEISFDDVTTEGPLQLGLAGASLSSGFTHFDLNGLVGEVFNTRVEAFGQAIDLPLPGGLTLKGELPLIGYTEVKTDYYALADPGFRVAWSFAGNMEVGELMQMAMGGGFDVGTALTTLLPYFETFEHGVRSAPDVVALPRIVDEDDVDSDGDVQEMVPDYDRFPVRDQTPDHAQQLRVSINVPAPPPGRGQGTDATLVFAGTDVEGIGFVPLGVTASVEAETIATKMAAPHSGIQGGTYAVTAISARIDQELPREVSALVARHDRLPAEVNLGERFLPYPAGAEWDDAERVMSGVGVDGASAHRAVLESEEGRWTIWFVGESLTAALPASPEGVTDQAGGASPRFEALLLSDDMSVDDLLAEGGLGDLADVDSFATGFSRILP